MADVMGRGHGGDGAGDEPPPGGDEWWRAGGHRQDGKFYNIHIYIYI